VDARKKKRKKREDGGTRYTAVVPLPLPAPVNSASFAARRNSATWKDQCARKKADDIVISDEAALFASHALSYAYETRRSNRMRNKREIRIPASRREADEVIKRRRISEETNSHARVQLK